MLDFYTGMDSWIFKAFKLVSICFQGLPDCTLAKSEVS